MDSICNQLLNVKGMVVEDARIVDSPLRPVPVLEIRVRPRKGMPRCPRCGRRRHGYDQGGGVRRWRHQDFGCWRVELVASMPRVDCPECGVVVASVPWAEPGSRFTKDFEAECAWLMGVASQETVGGFLHIAWRTAGDVARRVAERVKASMPSPFDGLTAIGVDETSHRKGHTYITVVVDHERHRVVRARGELNHWVFWASHSRIPEIVELSKKIRRRRPDILRTIRLGCSNARLEASDNRIKVTIRMAYGLHHVGNLIALIMLRCGGLDIRLPQPAI